MVTLTPEAVDALNKFFETTPKQPVRVYVARGKCAGGSLMLILSLDTPNEDDEVEEKSSFTFCMSKKLKAFVRNVQIDCRQGVFKCTPQIPLPELPASASCTGRCGSCGSSCGI